MSKTKVGLIILVLALILPMVALAVEETVPVQPRAQFGCQFGAAVGEDGEQFICPVNPDQQFQRRGGCGAGAGAGAAYGQRGMMRGQFFNEDGEISEAFKTMWQSRVEAMQSRFNQRAAFFKL